jgi:large subunit ribosomal protein L4
MGMEKQVLALDGSDLRNIELREEVFNIDVSEGSIYHAIRNELANQRTGTASTKTRGEVRGSTRKPWRQKGVGRARAGRRRSPVWVGGGITFGPKPRDYTYKLPRKIKRLAIKSIFTLKSREDRIKIVEDFKVESGKTKDLVKILQNFVPNESTVLILADEDSLLKRAGSNIPWLKFLAYNRLRAHDIFYGKNLLFLETAVKKVNEMYGNGDGE